MNRFTFHRQQSDTWDLKRGANVALRLLDLRINYRVSALRLAHNLEKRYVRTSWFSAAARSMLDVKAQPA